MASISPTSIQCAAEPYTGKNAHLKLTITSISDSDASTNKRYVGWKITVEGTSWATLSARYATLGGHEIRPFTSAGVFNWTTGQQLDSGTETYSNDASGNLTLYAYLKQLFYYSYNATSWANNSQAADANMVCSQLPRYANFTKHEISSTGINTFSVTWGADANCDAAQYSLNGGAWTNAAYPTYTISGLSPGTQYNIRTRIKRSDSQLWTTSGYLYPTTASLPTTNTPSNFNLGSSPTASISSMSNLSKWYCDVYDGNTKIASSGDVTATSKTISLTSSTIINGMLGRHPNNNDWTITFKYYCVSNGVTYTLTQRTCKCIIPSGQYVPTFNANNISYEVTDTQSLNLTGSNKKVIKGISDVLVTLTPASPNGSATMKSYNATSGNSTGSTTNISTPKINLTNVSANSVTAQAVDSRNRTTNANKAFSTFIDYFAPVITSSSINRIDGVGTNLTVNITGNYCNWSGLTTTNIIEQVSIQYKLKSASTYTTISGVNLNIVNSSGTFTITGNITGNHFSASNEYDVLLTFKDKINNLPFHQVIPTGEALLWRDKLNKRIGIGKKPEATLDVAGNISTDGAFQKSGVNFLRNNGTATILSAKNDIMCFRPKGDGDTASQATLDTGGNLNISGNITSNKVIKGKLQDDNSGYIGSDKSGLSSYWFKLWDATITNQQYNDWSCTLQTNNRYSNQWGQIGFGIRQNGANNKGAYNFGATLRRISGNVPLDKLRLYYNNSTGYCALYVNVASQYGVFPYKVIAKNSRTSAETQSMIGTFYSGNFTAAQTLPSSSYVIPVDDHLEKPVVLYNNATGAFTNITLSESAANFSYIEVYGGVAGGSTWTSTKVHAPNGQNFYIGGQWQFNDHGAIGIQTCGQVMHINDKSMTLVNSFSFNIVRGNNTTVPWCDVNTNSISIKYVVGYR